MRTEADLVNIQFSMSGTIQLDMERVEEDPIWQLVARTLPDNPEAREWALKEYINRYLSNESLLQNMPSTNGPASLTGNTIILARRSGEKS